MKMEVDEDEDDNITFVNNAEEKIIDEVDDAIDQALSEILGDDPYRRKYNYEQYPETSLYCPDVEKIEALIKTFPVPVAAAASGSGFTTTSGDSAGFLDLKKALRSFRARKNMRDSRSPSPVFLSQSQLLAQELRETSTPLVENTGTV